MKIDYYENSVFRYLGHMCIGFWVMIFALERLPSLIEGKGDFTTFLLSLSIMIIAIDLLIRKLDFYIYKCEIVKGKKEEKNNGK